MSNKTIIAVVAAAAVLYLVWRRTQAMAQPALVPQSLLDWAASPSQDAAYWALMSGGTPSTAGSTGAGSVTPGTMTQWLGHLFPGAPQAWGAPNAATNPLLQSPAGPPGATIPPNPVPPQQPTPQSAVQSSSPWLPSDFALLAPVSSSPWATDLTLGAPLASLVVGSGDFIDAKVV